MLQKIILDSAGAKPIKGRPGAKLPKADFAAANKELAGKIKRRAARRGRAVLPAVPAGVPRLSRSTLDQYDNTSVLPTPAFFYGLQSGEEIAVEIEPGKTLIVSYLTTGEPREDGTRTVFFELNGQPREVVRARPLAGRRRCTSTPRPTPTTPTTSPPRCRARCRPSR